MGILDKDNKRPNRRPAMRGVVMQDVCAGVERVRAWPVKRKKRLSPKQKEQMAWFAEAQMAARYIAPQLLADAAAATANGPILPRDILTMMFAGRLCSFINQFGKEVFPMAVARDVSESLDAISQTPGSIIFRGEELWEHVPAGAQGEYLRMMGGRPQWVTGASGGGVIAAFTYQDGVGLTQAFNIASATLTGTKVKIDYLNPLDNLDKVWLLGARYGTFGDDALALPAILRNSADPFDLTTFSVDTIYQNAGVTARFAPDQLWGCVIDPTLL